MVILSFKTHLYQTEASLTNIALYMFSYDDLILKKKKKIQNSFNIIITTTIIIEKK